MHCICVPLKILPNQEKNNVSQVRETEGNSLNTLVEAQIGLKFSLLHKFMQFFMSNMIIQKE